MFRRILKGNSGCCAGNLHALHVIEMPVAAKSVILATLTGRTARLLRRIEILSQSGYRVVSPRASEGIVALLTSVSCAAVLVDNSVDPVRRTAILRRVRQHFPDLVVVHVYQRGENGVEPLADANVDASDPADLVKILESLIPTSRGTDHDS